MATKQMTRGAKALWFGLLVLTLGASLKIPTVLPAVTKPPNTNTYGCVLAWDAVPFADQYKVFLGDSPTSLKFVTNSTGPVAFFRIFETNIQPWIGVTAVVQGQESDLSQLLTRTNYLRGWTEAQTPTGWEQVSNTTFAVEMVKPIGLYRMHAHVTDNWPKQP